jgi:hypothetical protein
LIDSAAPEAAGQVVSRGRVNVGAHSAVLVYAQTEATA